MRQNQNGFSLLEMIVATALTSLIGVWSATTWVQQSEDAASQAMGRWLLTVKDSVDKMLIRQADFLVGLSSANQSQEAYQDVWRPTLSELIRAGHLSASFSLRPPLGYDLSIRVLKPVGKCLTLGCKVEVFTIATPQASQYEQSGQVTRIGKIMSSLDGHGATVTPLSPQWIRGPNLQLANPPSPDMTALPIGSIVLHSFHDSSAQVSFLRQGEKRDVHLGANLDLAGRLTAKGDIVAAGRVAASGHLQLGAIGRPGEPCDEGGLLAQSSAGGLLVCQGGVWQKSANGSGGQYIERAGFPCHLRDGVDIERRNPMTGDCTCPEGYKPYLISVWRFPFWSYNEFQTFQCVN